MRHTLVALVEDKPGVLNRVASLFRRRVFNIESLTVGHTDQPGISRMTIVIDSNQTNAERVTAYLHKLINVIYVGNLAEKPSVSRDLALIKVKASVEVGKIADRYGARILDHSDGLMVVESSDQEERVEMLINELRPLGIIELVRTGVVAMGQGDLIVQTDRTLA